MGGFSFFFFYFFLFSCFLVQNLNLLLIQTRGGWAFDSPLDSPCSSLNGCTFVYFAVYVCIVSLSCICVTLLIYHRTFTVHSSEKDSRWGDWVEIGM